MSTTNGRNPHRDTISEFAAEDPQLGALLEELHVVQATASMSLEVLAAVAKARYQELFDQALTDEDGQRLANYLELHYGHDGQLPFVKLNGELCDPLALARRELRLDRHPRLLKRVIRRSRVDPLFDLELADGTLIPVGDAEAMLDPRKVARALAATILHAPPHYGSSRFRDCGRALLHISELEDTGTTPGSELCAWLAELLNTVSAMPIDLEDASARQEALTHAHRAFWATDERLYVHLPALEEYVRRFLHVPTTTRDLTARLARLGFEPHRVEGPRHERGARIAKRRYWRSPPGFDPDEDPPVSPPDPTSMRARERTKTAGDTGDTGDTAPHLEPTAPTRGDTAGTQGDARTPLDPDRGQPRVDHTDPHDPATEDPSC